MWMLAHILYISFAEVGRVLKICTEVKVLLLRLKLTQVKVVRLRNYSSKSKKVSGQKTTWSTSYKFCFDFFIPYSKQKEQLSAIDIHLLFKPASIILQMSSSTGSLQWRLTYNKVCRLYSFNFGLIQSWLNIYQCA